MGPRFINKIFGPNRKSIIWCK